MDAAFTKALDKIQLEQLPGFFAHSQKDELAASGSLKPDTRGLAEPDQDLAKDASRQLYVQAGLLLHAIRAKVDDGTNIQAFVDRSEESRDPHITISHEELRKAVLQLLQLEEKRVTGKDALTDAMKNQASAIVGEIQGAAVVAVNNRVEAVAPKETFRQI